MRHRVLCLRLHFAKSERRAFGEEHRIIPEATASPRRPNQRAVDAALIVARFAVGSGDRECADEMRLAPLGRGRTDRLQLFFDIAHGQRKILGWPGPACRIDARITV